MSLLDVQQQHAVHCTPTQDFYIHVNSFVTQYEKNEKKTEGSLTQVGE